MVKVGSFEGYFVHYCYSYIKAPTFCYEVCG